jgi:hypothetical protein
MDARHWTSGRGFLKLVDSVRFVLAASGKTTIPRVQQLRTGNSRLQVTSDRFAVKLEFALLGSCVTVLVQLVMMTHYTSSLEHQTRLKQNLSIVSLLPRGKWPEIVSMAEHPVTLQDLYKAFKQDHRDSQIERIYL